MESIYEYLKNELFLKKNYVPARVLDIGAWNGFWTKTCKSFWLNSHYTCIEAGKNHRKDLEAIAEDVHIADTLYLVGVFMSGRCRCHCCAFVLVLM